LQVFIMNKLTELVTEIARVYGATAKVEFHKIAFRVTSNTASESDLVLETARDIFGPDRVHELIEPVMAAEDFAQYLEKVPGCFFFVGNGLNSAPAHNPYYDFNDEIIPTAAEMLRSVAINYLNQEA
jgi:metal-dependent amidase/aminoacylase/carboxypeptidase family protein